MTAIDFAAFVDQLAAVSGETIRPFFRTALGVENKSRSGSFDPVTAADRTAEAAMRALIKTTFPEHGILGEEFDAERPDADICGMPAWGTLIALTRRGEPIYGMMHQPFTREYFTGDGSAASYRGPAGDRALRTRGCAELKEAVLLTTSPLLMREPDRQCFGRVEGSVRLSRYGGDCYAYCMLAAGQVDLVIETELKPYDVLPLIPIIEGAGGVITSWENGRPHGGGRVIAAGDRRVHAQAMELLQS
jgi:myo-inositol-1(or 4)-monophosphatase